MTDEPFLKRWSDRKRQARAAEAAPEPEPKPEPEATPEPAPEPLGEEELARLTPIEEMTPATDLGQYLRKGVPEALRRAALRRMWTLDPAIRDYLDVARDYAWDWNAPAGVPGSGALAPSAALAEVVKRLVPAPPAAAVPTDLDTERRLPAPRPSAPSAAAIPPVRETERQPPAPPAQAPAAATPPAPDTGVRPPAPRPPAPAAASPAAPEPVSGPVADAAPTAPLEAPPRRRHGGARPSRVSGGDPDVPV